MMILSAKENGANIQFAPFLLVLAFANIVFANVVFVIAFSRNLLDFANRKSDFANMQFASKLGQAQGGALRHTPLCSMFNVHVKKKKYKKMLIF